MLPESLPPMFRYSTASDRVCTRCPLRMRRLLAALRGEWFACPRCDAP